MTDIFREVEEDVRRERFEQLWKKYGDYVIAGASLLIIAVAGLQLWRVYDQRQRARASTEYMAAEQLYEAGQTYEAATAFAKIAKDAPSGYAGMADLQAADALLASGNQADAVGIFKKIASGNNSMLGAIARIHAAWAIVDTAPKSDVQTMLAPLTDPTNAWHSMAREILAYADYRAGATKDALREYESLLGDAQAPVPLRTRSEWMVTFLKAGGDRDFGTVPMPVMPQVPGAPQETANPPPPQGAPGGSPPK